MHNTIKTIRQSDSVVPCGLLKCCCQIEKGDKNNFKNVCIWLQNRNICILFFQNTGNLFVRLQTLLNNSGTWKIFARDNPGKTRCTTSHEADDKNHDKPSEGLLQQNICVIYMQFAYQFMFFLELRHYAIRSGCFVNLFFLANFNTKPVSHNMNYDYHTSTVEKTKLFLWCVRTFSI